MMKIGLTEYDREYYSKQRAINRRYRKNWREKHPEESKIRAKQCTYKRNKRLREEFFRMYGDKCLGCGETNVIFLTLDHVCNDGNKSRCTTSNISEYEIAIKDYQPEKYQTLCFNCNLGKNRVIRKSTSEDKPWTRHRINMRKTFFEMYGKRCACCGTEKSVYLTLDHVQNDGYKTKKSRGDVNYRCATKKYRPDVYQVLCFNCNCGKHRNGGTCPHQKLK
jgi:uncharacterized protein YeaC (DUF1315 family)